MKWKIRENKYPCLSTHNKEDKEAVNKSQIFRANNL